MQIDFPMGSALDFDTNTVAFLVDVNGVRRRCLVSAEALQDHFDGIRADLVEAFEANRDRIQLAAEEKIRAGVAGTILLKSTDF